jgi:hypothetical protein
MIDLFQARGSGFQPHSSFFVQAASKRLEAASTSDVPMSQPLCSLV